MSLQECVAKGMELAEGQNEVFTWLTATNRGAGDICTAALLNKGITTADTDLGYYCDPATSTRAAALSTVHYVM